MRVADPTTMHDERHTLLPGLHTPTFRSLGGKDMGLPGREDEMM